MLPIRKTETRQTEIPIPLLAMTYTPTPEDFAAARPCRACNGSGEEVKPNDTPCFQWPCAKCGGTGRMPVERAETPVEQRVTAPEGEDSTQNSDAK